MSNVCLITYLICDVHPVFNNNILKCFLLHTECNRNYWNSWDSVMLYIFSYWAEKTRNGRIESMPPCSVNFTHIFESYYVGAVELLNKCCSKQDSVYFLQNCVCSGIILPYNDYMLHPSKEIQQPFRNASTMTTVHLFKSPMTAQEIGEENGPSILS